MRWLQKFMYGRYGVDQFSMFLLTLYFFITLIAVLLGQKWLIYLASILIFYSWYRMFSKKTYLRSKENTKYLQMIYPLKMWWNGKINRFKNRKTHKYFRCPNCKQELRVPKGKGEITITCPKCKCKFDKRT